MNLQPHFVHSVKLYFKEEGERWLQELPTIIKHVEDKWSLKLGKPYSLSINYVAPAVMSDGAEVVVKICIPGEGFLQELEALRLFRNNGMVQLMDSEEERGVLLLEKLSPGESLAILNDHEEAARIAANIMRNLVIPAPESTRIPTTKAREESLRNIVEQHPQGIGPISSHILKRALHIFAYLTKSIKQQYLLHGDFHHYNVISSGKNQWTAIDPKGLIGEIEYDLIQFMLNKLPDQGAINVIKRRVEIVTEELQLNKERLLLWGYCHTVLATSWGVDEDGSFNQSFFQGIEIFETLYRTEFGEMPL
ncbi:aminoglycoside phosphotransferase family protein [Bacillus sp. PS06]|uniref:aminoglycoside phosphotransferase family protein n=1 Tax=Bacillus sp. PS06 TaxID=2764176 RepID=UPI001780CA04|nr:aminoglycoside phosphotransferase family protein [Bacillus sp. PS06]MBD8069087.1 hydrogenase expression protein HypB [Bacillus sp. PS06]